LGVMLRCPGRLVWQLHYLLKLIASRDILSTRITL
jgi:hypothetical protein